MQLRIDAMSETFTQKCLAGNITYCFLTEPGGFSAASQLADGSVMDFLSKSGSGPKLNHKPSECKQRMID